MKTDCPRPDAVAASARGLLAAHLVLSPLFFSTLTQEAFEYGKVALLMLTALALVALGVQGLLRGGPASIRSMLASAFVPRTVLMLGVGLFFLSALLSTIFSTSPRVSWHGEPGSLGGLPTMGGFVILFVATRLLVRGSKEAWLLLAAAVIGTAGAASYALVQAVDADPLAWSRNSTLHDYFRPFGTLGHPNFLAGYLVMGAALLGCFLLRARNEQQRPSKFLCCGLLVLAVVMTGLSYTRGAWLALLAVAACYLIGLRGWRLRRSAWLGAGLVVALGLSALALPGMQERFQEMGALRSGSLQSRLHLWRAALALFAQHPVCGAGLDTFHLVFGSVRTPAFNLIEWNTTPLHAHNLVLDTLAGQGLLGGLAGVLLLVGLVQTARRAWYRPAADRTLLLGLIALLVGFLVQGMFSFTVAATGTLLVTAAALLSRLAEEDAAAETVRPGLRAGLLAGVLLAAVLFVGNLCAAEEPLRAAVVFGRLFGIGSTVATGVLLLRGLASEPAGNSNMDESTPARRQGAGVVMLTVGAWCLAGVLAFHWVVEPGRAELARRRGDCCPDPRQALEEYRAATLLEPGNENHWYKLAKQYQALAAQANAADERGRLLEEARTACTQAVALVPMNAAFRGTLARLFTDLARLQRMDAAEALAEFDRALALDPNHAYLFADAANAALTLSQLERARDYAKRGLERYPRFGILRAHLGYILLVENRYPPAWHSLLRAVEADDWYDDENAHAFARRMLQVTNEGIRAMQKRRGAGRPR
ncbi:MAG: O-antigen ligase family protein [Gemmataceae bacterium]